MNLLDKKLSELLKNEKIKTILIRDEIIKEKPYLIDRVKDLLTLRDILRQKNINEEEYHKKLQFVIKDSQQFDITLNTEITDVDDKSAAVRVKGLLPCTVRVPLLETISAYKEENSNYFDGVSMELTSASVGLSWIKKHLYCENCDDLLDLFVSAGFDVFFESQYIGRFKEEGLFSDISDLSTYGDGFEQFKDPKSIYMMLGVVPAMFVVHLDNLNGRPIPRSWEDILSEDFRSSIVVPMKDYDMFNALLLGIHHLFGVDGVENFAKNTLTSCHPSQMLHSEKCENGAAISIMPYFFARLTKSNMEAVWPDEGSIASPIFMLAKKSKAEKLKPIVDLLLSDKVANILAGEGYFPSIKKGVDNNLMGNGKFVFPGWDYLHKEDVGGKIKELEDMYKNNYREML